MEDTSDDEDMDFEEDNLLEEGFFFLHEEDAIVEDSDHSDSNDDELSEDELDELQNEAEIKHFNAVLFKAQAMAVKAECVRATPKPASSMAHSTVTRALALWAHT